MLGYVSRFVKIGTKGLGVRSQRLLNCREAATTPEWRATNPFLAGASYTNGMRVCVGDKNGATTPARSRGRGIPQTIIFSIVEDMPRKPLAPHKPVFCATLVANEQTSHWYRVAAQGQRPGIPRS